ncbi:MAG: hypothetical protein MK554_00115 [Planctomycetes bacterium]|nr:hypothetical protein [Planctomycetota bacterium]
MSSRKRSVVVGVLGICLIGMSVRAGAQELVDAYIFGSRDLSCPVGNAPERDYRVVYHVRNEEQLAALEYGEAQGWGYEVIDPGNTGRRGWAQFGPFDDSPNNRNNFDDTCPNEIYDSFIGAKNFSADCDATLGDSNTPCTVPEGLVFRIDVPNGSYRFVGAFGEANSRHAHRIVVENGGAGPSDQMSDDHVVLVNNFDQAEHCPGTFARVGFGDRLPPVGEGNGPQFVNMDEDGYITAEAPSSPTLVVTEGYIRVHQLQGNANGGACGARDPNGGNAVLLELWRVEDEAGGGFLVGLDRSFNPAPYSPGQAVTVNLDVSNVLGSTTVAETFPDGWTVVEASGGAVEGNTITFTIDADDVIEYTVRSPAGQCGANTFSALLTPEGGCESGASSSVACQPVGCGLRSSGGPSRMLQIGPIDLGAQAGPACDDSGRLGTTDYLSDGETTESSILLEEGDEVLPDFGGEAGGAGVGFAVNANLNPGALDGVLDVWAAETDADGYIDYNLPGNIGDPVDDYVVYSLTYLENTTGDCLDAILEVGSDDAVKVILNGSMIHLNSVCRGMPAYGGGDMVPATLQSGGNVLLIAVVERGGGAGVRLAVRDTAGQPLVDGSILASCTPPADFSSAVSVTRTIDAPSPVEPESEINVVLDVSGVDAPVSVVETFPESLEVIDAGGGQVEGNTITFNVEADGEVIYVLALPEGDCPFETAEFSGSFEAENACGSIVRGEARVGCVQPPCEPDPEAPEAELVAAFVFGVHFDMCTSPNDEGFEYTIVRQEGPDSVAYDEARGWGYEVTAPGDASRAGYGQFGPFDDSPNDRNTFVGACPEAVYDSFIGAKNFPSICNAQTAGDPDVPCVEAGIPASGLVFRIDLPDNGLYRFVAAVGDAGNPHAHTIVVEDGGEGPPSELGQNELALLVQNFDQNQQTTGQVRADCLGCGVFARVGFDDKVPPMGDGIAPDPQFVNYDSDGLATPNCPDSPFLEVTEGYIRLYQLQGNANVGPGSKSNGTVVDANGGDMVLLEVWRIDDGGGPPPPPDEVCDNGIDDDEDGDTDCDDADCSDEESCREPAEDLFRRGDADANGAMQLTDAVFVLLYLFSGGGEPPCMEASDADDNGALQLTDAVYVLLYLFSGGDAPPAPGAGECGADTGDVDLGCGAYDTCGA